MIRLSGWDYAPFDVHHNPEPYIEIRLKLNVPLLLIATASNKLLMTSKDPRSSLQEIVQSVFTKWEALDHASVLSGPDLCVLWKESSTARVRSKWVPSSLSRVEATSTGSLHCQSRLSCTSRFGTPSIPELPKPMLWTSMSGSQELQALRSMLALCAIMCGIPALTGSKTLPTLTCWLCMACRIP